MDGVQFSIYTSFSILNNMKILSIAAVLIVAALHLGFLVLEMFLWQQPAGLAVFSMTADEAASSAILAANQGLYNGFLAVGLIWGLLTGKRDVVTLFLLFVVVAGIYGAATASGTILYVQAAPAAIALLLHLFQGKKAVL